MEKFKAISTKGLTKDLINKYSILNGVKYLYSGILQSYFAFIPAKKYIKYFSGTIQIYSWKSNEISEESIERIAKSNSLFAPTFVIHFILSDVNFNGHGLINNNISIPKNVIDVYISYILNPWSRDLNTDFTLNNCLLRSAELTKNADPDKCKYSGTA